MGRIRTLKPGFFSDEELSALPAEVHLLAAGLLCYADDEGFFNAHPKLVQAAIFPIRENFGRIPEMLRSLQTIGYLRLGKSRDGKLYGQVANFLIHQRVSHPTLSVIKGLKIDWSDSAEIPEDSEKALETFVPERNGIEEELNKEWKGCAQTQKCEKAVDCQDKFHIARAVSVQIKISSERVMRELVSQSEIELKDGKEFAGVVANMVAAWEDYSKAKPKLEFQCGAEKFFGEGIWRDMLTWPWKEQHRPKRRTFVDA